jgi:hypothetical protein
VDVTGDCDGLVAGQAGGLNAEYSIRKKVIESLLQTPAKSFCLMKLQSASPCIRKEEMQAEEEGLG